MAQPPQPTAPGDTVPVGRDTLTPTAVPIVPSAAGRAAPPPGTLSWGRALRSAWPLALGVALLTTGLLGLELDHRQPHTYQGVVVLAIDPTGDEPSVAAVAHVASLRRVGEDRPSWDGAADGLPAPYSPGLVVLPSEEPGTVELRLRGGDPAALEAQLRAVVARHRTEMADYRSWVLDECRAGLGRVEEQLAHLPGPTNTGHAEAVAAAKKVADLAEGHAAALRQRLAALPATAVPIDRLLADDPDGARLLRRRDRTLAEKAEFARVAAAGPTRDDGLRRYARELTEIDLLLDRTRDHLAKAHAGKDATAEWTAALRTAQELADAARTNHAVVCALPPPADTARAERLRLEERRQDLVEALRHLTDSPAAAGVEVRHEATAPVGLAWRYATTFGVAALAGLSLAGLVVAYHRARGRVRSADELILTTGLPCLGRLPLVAGQVVPIPGLRPTGPSGPEFVRLEAAADQARGPLLRQLPTSGPVRLLVTSPGTGDGRTTAAAQLACSLARAGKRVLLVDASLGRSDLAWLFQVEPDPGLGEVLRGEREPGDVVQATAFSRLWLLPAGHLDAQARAALSQEWMGRLFEPVVSRFDVIVVDGPPLSAATEAGAWVARAQAVLLTVRSGHTSLADAYAASHQLHLLHAPVVGVVLLEPAESPAAG